MKVRILSAIVLVLIFAPLMLIGGTPFTLLMGVVGIVSTYELLHLRSEKKEFPLLPYLFTYLWVFYLIINKSMQIEMSFVLDYRILIVVILSFFLPIILIADSKKYNIEDAFYLFGTTLFLGTSYHLITMLRDESLYYIIFLFIITVFTDSFAYITGCMVGRHKLLPSVSPNKTVEGLIGGTVMAVIVSSIFYIEVINPDISLVTLLIATVSLSLIGQLGDLVFSAIKRYYGKKDFSNLIPGHGGMLDRFDSIIFVALAASIFYFLI